MLLRAWFRPPRHLLALFLLITLVPSVLLIALGWRSLRQDRARQVQDSREQAADLAVSSLQQSLSEAERRLQDLSIPPADDSAIVQFEPDSVKGNLLFYPFTTAGKEAPASIFAPGEDLEFHARDYAKAATFFSGLARSADPAIRAGALIRQARNLRKSGLSRAALAVYRQAAEVRGVAVAGVPADLFARWAACELLTGDELHREVESLRSDLMNARWRLDRATFDLHFQDTGRWLGDASAPPAPALALAEGAEHLWRSWQSAPRPSGRETVPFEGRDLTILWTGDTTRLTALIAGPDFVERTWIAKLAPMLARQHARVSLRDQAAPA